MPGSIPLRWSTNPSSRAPSRQGHHQNSPKRNLIFRWTLIFKTQICLKYLWVLSKVNISEIFLLYFLKLIQKWKISKNLAEKWYFTLYTTVNVPYNYFAISHLSLSDLAEWLRTDCQCQSRNRSEFDPSILCLYPSHRADRGQP
jgi:hypothetical protein